MGTECWPCRPWCWGTEADLLILEGAVGNKYTLGLLLCEQLLVVGIFYSGCRRCCVFYTSAVHVILHPQVSVIHCGGNGTEVNWNVDCMFGGLPTFVSLMLSSEGLGCVSSPNTLSISGTCQFRHVALKDTLSRILKHCITILLSIVYL